jgi:hypothetical protein
MLSALRGGNLLGFLSQLAYNSGILSKFVFLPPPSGWDCSDFTMLIAVQSLGISKDYETPIM